MEEKEKQKIACHVCQKMIPKAAALHAEGKEYVLHFCDISCLDHWQKEQAKEPEPAPKAKNEAE